MHCRKGCIHIGSSSLTRYYVIYIPQNTGILVSVSGKKNVLAHSNIQKAERFMYYLIPWLYFYSSCKKRKKNHVCTIHYWSFYGLGWSMRQTNTIVLSLICTVKDVLSFSVYVHSGRIHLLSLELLPSISVIDWFQQSSSDWSLSLVYLTIALWGKKQSCLHSSSFAEAPVCFNVALHLKDFCFLSVHLMHSIWISSQVVKA